LGPKYMSWQIQSYAALLSKATAKPIKLVLTKEEHLAAFTLRPETRIHARVGMKKDGTVTGSRGQMACGHGLLFDDHAGGRLRSAAVRCRLPFNAPTGTWSP